MRVNASSFRALGRVKHFRERSGAALEFLQLSAGGSDMLRELVAQLSRLRLRAITLGAGDRRKDLMSRSDLDTRSCRPIGMKDRLPLFTTIRTPKPPEEAALNLTREKPAHGSDAEASSLDLFV